MLKASDSFYHKKIHKTQEINFHVGSTVLNQTSPTLLYERLDGEFLSQIQTGVLNVLLTLTVLSSVGWALQPTPLITNQYRS